MTLRKEIVNIIKNGKEQDSWDYKSGYYAKEKTGDLIKDVASLANNTELKNKFLIFGVGDSGKIVGQKIEDLPDISSINQLLSENVEPFINTSWELIDNYENTGLSVAALVIVKSNSDQPYLMRKDYNKKGTNLPKGTIYLRKGATNMVAGRIELDKIYNLKKRLLIEIIRDEIYISEIGNLKGREKLVIFDAVVSNYSELDINIKNISVKFIITEQEFLSEIKYLETEPLKAVDKATSLKDKSEIMKKGTQKSFTAYFSFSDNCYKFIQDNLNSLVECIFELMDTDGNKYYVRKSNMKFVMKEGA